MNVSNKKNSFFLFQILATLTFFFFLFLFAWKIIGHFSLQHDLQGNWVFLTFFLGAFIAYLAADFASGMLHFICDNFGSEKTFLIGKHFIQPFRQHHDDPVDITRHGFFETNANNCLVCLPILIPLYYFLPLNTVFFYAIAIFFWFFLVWIFATNQFHKWAHQPTPSPLVKFLQKIHLILPIDHHQIHHTPPHDQYYCITNGWLNSFLTKIGFFEAIIRIFKKRSKIMTSSKHSS